MIDGLIDSRQAADAVSIAGFALSAVLEALEQTDDSDGWIGGSAQELADAHARACAAAPCCVDRRAATAKRIKDPSRRRVEFELFERKVDREHRVVRAYAIQA